MTNWEIIVSSGSLILVIIAVGMIVKIHTRFILISRQYTNNPKNIQKYLIKKAQLHLDMLKLLQAGASYDKKHIAYVKKDGEYVNIIFPYLSKKFYRIHRTRLNKTKIHDIRDILTRQKLI